MLLVTGATGFVGRSLVARALMCDGISVRAAVRTATHGLPSAVEIARIGDVSETTDWTQALAGADVVVHLAARVHVMRDAAADPLAEFRRVNVAGTLQLARSAARAGSRRFVYLSSVKVNGEGGDTPYRETDPPSPRDPYGVSKHEAETGLRALAAETGLEVVIIRPPLVYGPGVKGNFRSLMRLVARGVPLPFGAVHNCRSLVGLDNLVDLILTCVRRPQAANETFLVSDGNDLSTTQLIRELAYAMGKSPRLIPVPASALGAAAALLGKRGVAQRLLGSLQVDISKARLTLGWQPPNTVQDGLRQAVRG